MSAYTRFEFEGAGAMSIFPTGDFGNPCPSICVHVMPRGVVRDINPAGWTTAKHPVGVHLHLPHAGEKRVRIAAIHIQTGTSGIQIHEEHARPVLAAVGGFINAAFLLRSRGPVAFFPTRKRRRHWHSPG